MSSSSSSSRHLPIAEPHPPSSMVSSSTWPGGRVAACRAPRRPRSPPAPCSALRSACCHVRRRPLTPRRELRPLAQPGGAGEADGRRGGHREPGPARGPGAHGAHVQGRRGRQRAPAPPLPGPPRPVSCPNLEPCPAAAVFWNWNSIARSR